MPGTVGEVTQARWLIVKGLIPVAIASQSTNAGTNKLLNAAETYAGVSRRAYTAFANPDLPLTEDVCADSLS